MKVQALFIAYPAVVQAISWVELIICESDDGEETAWELIIRHEPNISPQDMLDYMKKAIEGEDVGRLKEAEAQMDHPQFLRYLAGKLGAY